MFARISLSCGMALALLFASVSAPADAQGLLRDRLRQYIKQRGAGSQKLANLQDGQLMKLAGLNCAVWEPANTDAPAPLVLFSHGFRGMNIQSVPLMKALRDAGYLVVAPNHKDAIGARLNREPGRPQKPLGQPTKWTDSTYRDRGDDITHLMHWLEQDPKWSSKLDWTKVALVGHSLGGYTVLALAGAWPSWKLDGVKAVIALSPYSHPFNQKSNLGGLKLPVMYQTGTVDFGVAPFLKGPNGSFAKTSSPAYLVDIKGANHFTWTGLNREKSKEDLIDHYCISFLDKFVKGDQSARPEDRLKGVTALMVK